MLTGAGAVRPCTPASSLTWPGACARPLFRTGGAIRDAFLTATPPSVRRFGWRLPCGIAHVAQRIERRLRNSKIRVRPPAWAPLLAVLLGCQPAAAETCLPGEEMPWPPGAEVAVALGLADRPVWVVGVDAAGQWFLFRRDAEAGEICMVDWGDVAMVDPDHLERRP